MQRYSAYYRSPYLSSSSSSTDSDEVKDVKNIHEIEQLVEEEIHWIYKVIHFFKKLTCHCLFLMLIK
jgi:hypothetical protein